MTRTAPAKRSTPRKRRDKRGAKKGQFGQKPFEATAEQRIQVEAYVAAGAQQPLIAEFVGISEDTLQRHFRNELEHGKHRALTKIGGSMIKKALEGDHDSGKFVLARIGGWKTTIASEQSGPDGGPIVYAQEPPRRDLSGLSDEELEIYEKLTAKLEQRERPSDQ